MSKKTKANEPKPCPAGWTRCADPACGCPVSPNEHAHQRILPDGTVEALHGYCAWPFAAGARLLSSAA